MPILAYSSADFQPIKVIFGNNKETWAVIGRVCKDKHSRTNAALVNRVTVEREMLLDRCEEVPTRSPLKNLIISKELTSPRQVSKMMELDYSEIPHTRKIRGTNNPSPLRINALEKYPLTITQKTSKI